MKIVDIFTKKVLFKCRKTFRISYDQGSNISSRIYVKILTDDGIFGLGEAAPYPPVTGKTLPLLSYS